MGDKGVAGEKRKEKYCMNREEEKEDRFQRTQWKQSVRSTQRLAGSLYKLLNTECLAVNQIV
jgi:hypothetical protein